MGGGMTDIALYDLDRTITRRATYTPFLLHAAWRHERWRLLLVPAVIASMLAYVFGFVDRGRLKEINHGLMIGPKIAPETLAQLAESFAEATLARNVYPQALARIAADRAAGRRLVLATASYAFYALPIARRLGFDDVIGTGSLRDESGSVLARIDGENCYGEAKRRMLDDWVSRQNIARDGVHVRFYSDSSSDLPVFDWSDEPVATNPSSKLRKIADQRSWAIIAWG